MNHVINSRRLRGAFQLVVSLSLHNHIRYASSQKQSLHTGSVIPKQDVITCDTVKTKKEQFKHFLKIITATQKVDNSADLKAWQHTRDFWILHGNLVIQSYPPAHTQQHS